jgi:hypothetical protein
MTPEEIDMLFEKAEQTVTAIIETAPDEAKADLATFLAVTLATHAASSKFEAIGILDEAKESYRQLYDEVMMEESMPDCDNCDNEECQFKKFKDN